MHESARARARARVCVREICRMLKVMYACYVCMRESTRARTHLSVCMILMWWLWLVGSIKLQVSFSKKPYKRDNILQKRPIILAILLTVATPYVNVKEMFGM